MTRHELLLGLLTESCCSSTVRLCQLRRQDVARGLSNAMLFS